VSDAEKQWGERLKQARVAAGLSQKQLGIEAGIDAFVASTRINRYELGVHRPDLLTAQNLANVLGVPAAFFYAQEDSIADLLFKYSRAPSSIRKQVQRLLSELPSIDSDPNW
jgi:transcriptional regulator with XRE-family HTH domain